MKVRPVFTFPKALPRPAQQAIKKAVVTTLRLLPRYCLRMLNSKKNYTLAVSVVTDTVIHRLNRQYRKKNRPTDVLAFPAPDALPSAAPEIGDVIISLQTARRQAFEFNVPLTEELARLTVHGVLHLFGYDHEVSRKEAGRMFRMQERILKKLFPLLSNRLDGIQPRRSVGGKESG